jgi:peptide/nickel transport system substrate-binding protein
VLRRAAISCLLAVVLPMAARTRPHYGGTLHVEIAGDPWQRGTGIARRLVFDGLTVFDAAGNVQPALAVQWQADNADHRWEFKLRPGVQFQDGTSVTSVNVAAALNADCTEHCPWTAVHAVGGAVVFTGDAPMPNLPALLASDEFLLALTLTADGRTPAGDTGTGPFQLKGFNNGVMTLTANENCWRGRPFADAVEIRMHRAVRDQWLDLSVGRADVVEVPPEMLRQARGQRLNVIVAPTIQLLELQVNNAGPLTNPIMRAAISLSVDRAALANVIFQKQAEASASLLPQSVSGYSFLFATDRDLNKARELRGGLSAPALQMSYEGGATMQLAAQRIALNLKETGLDVQTVPAGGVHADLALRMVPMETRDPAALLDLLMRASGDPEPQGASFANSATLYKTERDFLAEHFVIPLLDLPRAYAAGPRVRDLELGADGAPGLADASLEDAP